MADNKSADADSIDTSTNEEAQDTDGDLEDIEVNLDDMNSADETDETDDSEQNEEDPDTDQDESEEQSEDDDESEETEEQSEETDDSDEETEEDDAPSEAEQKRINNENARKRIAEREAKEAKKAKAQQEYIEEAEDDQDLALRQLQVDAYNNKVEGNKNKLQNGVDRALADIELFRTGPPEAKEELLRRLDAFEAQYVQYDQNGDPVQVKGDVYQYLQTEADSIQRLTGVGVRQQAKSKSKVKARTTTPPARTPKEPPKDELLDAFDEEAGKY